VNKTKAKRAESKRLSQPKPNSKRLQWKFLEWVTFPENKKTLPKERV
jgi:hypothetical protein